MRSIAVITPNGVRHVNTVRCGLSGLLATVDLKEIRRARLAQFAKQKSVEDDPSGLAALIGKKANQLNNLLSGRASFGEKVARSIEVAAKLPTLWLDIDQDAGEQLPGWPFSQALLDRLVALNDTDRAYVEGRLEEAIISRESSSPALSIHTVTNQPVASTTSDSATKTSAYVESLKRGKRGAQAGVKSRGASKSRGGRGSKGTA